MVSCTASTHFIALQLPASDLEWHKDVDGDLDKVPLSCRELEVSQFVRVVVDELAVRVA